MTYKEMADQISKLTNAEKNQEMVVAVPTPEKCVPYLVDGLQPNYGLIDIIQEEKVLVILHT